MSEGIQDLNHSNPEKSEAVVTPDAIRGRVLSFFEGVDFSKPGASMHNGFERVVYEDNLDHHLHTSKAFFQGHKIATIEKGSGIGGQSEDDTYYSLDGRDGEKDIDLTAWFMEGEEPYFTANSESEDDLGVSSQSSLKNKIPPERLSEIARILGVIE